VRTHFPARRSRALLAGLIGGAALTAGAGLAYASIPGPDGNIHACYARSNGVYLAVPHSKGDVRIVDSSEACRGYETAIAWTQNQPAPAALPRSLYATGSNVVASFATPVMSLDMPVGTWVVNFKASEANFGTLCRLDAQAGGYGVAGSDIAIANGTNTGDTVPFTLTARMTFTSPGTASVECSSESSKASETSVIEYPVMTAIEVATP
jgi:hypothetical protein